MLEADFPSWLPEKCCLSFENTYWENEQPRKATSTRTQQLLFPELVHHLLQSHLQAVCVIASGKNASETLGIAFELAKAILKAIQLKRDPHISLGEPWRKAGGSVSVLGYVPWNLDATVKRKVL